MCGFVHALPTPCKFEIMRCDALVDNVQWLNACPTDDLVVVVVVSTQTIFAARTN
jgi:hypothetical protein